MEKQALKRHGFWVALAMCLAACGRGGGTATAPDSDVDGIADAIDCAPSDATRSQHITYQSVDRDGDGVFINESGEACISPSQASHYSSTPAAAGASDCSDNDATKWQLLSYSATDLDGDQRQTTATAQICSGQSLPIGYFATHNTLPDDCDDSDSSRWRIVTVYIDTDGDGFGSGTGIKTCMGTTAPNGLSLYGYDPVSETVVRRLVP